MAPYTSVPIVNFAGTTVLVSVGFVTASSVGNVQVDEMARTLSFNASGSPGLLGFCRTTLPNIIVQTLWKNNLTVYVNGVPLPFTNSSDDQNTYLYFMFPTSEDTVRISQIPEFNSFILLPLMMPITLLTATARKRKRKNHP
jgi:hypothetical protein